MRVITIGLIGVGDILHAHLNAMRANPEYKLTGICRRSPDKLKAQAEKLGVKGYVDYRALLQDKPDVALISLPHNLHFTAALDALAAGCHVLLEKPAVIGMDEANALLAAAARAQRAIVVTESAYWQPLNRMARDVVAGGALGKLLFAAYVNHRFYFTPERPAWFLQADSSGGGQFINIGMHRVASVRCIIGDAYEEISVAAAVHKPRPEHDIEAATYAMVGYADGAAVTYEEFGGFRPPAETPAGLRLVFENGMLGVTRQDIWISDKGGKVAHHAPDATACEPYTALYGEMLKALDGREHYPMLRHGLLDVRIALAAYAASAKRGVINLRDDAWRLAGQAPAPMCCRSSLLHGRSLVRDELPYEHAQATQNGVKNNTGLHDRKINPKVMERCI